MNAQKIVCFFHPDPLPVIYQVEIGKVVEKANVFVHYLFEAKLRRDGGKVTYVFYGNISVLECPGSYDC